MFFLVNLNEETKIYANETITRRKDLTNASTSYFIQIDNKEQLTSLKRVQLFIIKEYDVVPVEYNEIGWVNTSDILECYEMKAPTDKEQESEIDEEPLDSQTKAPSLSKTTITPKITYKKARINSGVRYWYQGDKIPPYIIGLNFVYVKETTFDKGLYFITNLPEREPIGILAKECLTFVD